MPDNAVYPTSRLVRLMAALPLATALLFLAGCGGSKGAKDSVSGKVTLGDQTVAGEVIFTYSDGKEGRSPIGPDGFYSIPTPSKGEAKIAVKGMLGGTGTPTSGPKSDMPMPGAAGGVAPPAKYGRNETSGLTYTVKGGEEKFDIPLTP